MRKIILGILSVILSGCSGYPKNKTPVKDFDMNKYLGKWYEIARLDHSFLTGPSNSYLWFLWRTPKPEDSTVARFIKEVESLGFPTDELIYVNHD